MKRLEEIRKNKIKEIYEKSKYFIVITNKMIEWNIPLKEKENIIKDIINSIMHLINIEVFDKFDIWLIEYEIEERMKKIK
jgi:hypothetical protein